MSNRTLTPPTLTDGVVTLRLARRSDAEPMTAALSEENTVRWLLSVPHPYDHAESLRWVDEIAPNGWRDGTLLFLTIADADDDAFLGEVGLTHLALEDQRAEVAYWLVPEARGRGAVRRALRLLLAWAFDELDLVRIDWGAHAGNVASRAAAEAVGFRFEGTRRGRVVRRYDGARLDEWCAGLLREDFVPA
ncbi:MAG TPA: GNAT family N-acetyltransferase [Candidatus Nanopelagicales bacterium]|nr:GNAT family N-acetyltransferase [Candidatus Nanopelagicales bacterium]